MTLKWFVYRQSELSSPGTTTELPLAECATEDEAIREKDRLEALHPELVGKIDVGQADPRFMGKEP